MELEARLREHLSVQFGACQAWHEEGVVEPGGLTVGGWRGLAGGCVLVCSLLPKTRCLIVREGLTFQETCISRGEGQKPWGERSSSDFALWL